MLRLAILFFVLAIGSAVLGFGGFAGTFTSLAVIAFYVFAAFLVFSLLAGLVGAGHWHSGGAFASLIIAALAGAGIYAWVDSGMSAQQLGARIDRNAATVTAEAEQAGPDRRLGDPAIPRRGWAFGQGCGQRHGRRGPKLAPPIPA